MELYYIKFSQINLYHIVIYYIINMILYCIVLYRIVFYYTVLSTVLFVALPLSRRSDTPKAGSLPGTQPGPELTSHLSKGFHFKSA